MKNKIQKLLRFLNKNRPTVHNLNQRVIEPKPNVFHLENMLLSVVDDDAWDDDAWDERDENLIIVDFNTETVNWQAEYESYHNGSSYGKVEVTLKWDNFIHQALPLLEQYARPIILHQIINEEEKRKEMERKNNANKRLMDIYESYEKDYQKIIESNNECNHNWVMEGHNAGDPVCSKCYAKE